jgi:YbgC/YbaW family acyl-CoA thioester hydrolase
MRFRARARTRWSDEDNQDVLNNAVYLTLLEEARHAYFRELGLLDGNRFPFLLAQCNLRFIAAGRGGAEVEIDIATTRLGSSSFCQAYRVRDAERGTVWAEAEAVLVCYHPESGRSAPMAPGFRAALARFEGLE